MKFLFLFLSVLATNAAAFSPSLIRNSPALTILRGASPSNDGDDRSNLKPAATVAALFLGMTLTTTPMPSVAETSLDFSLPTYDTKMSGFGEGTEARLNNGNTQRSEKDLQMEAMKKAENARLEAKAKKKAEVKAREEEDKRRAQERKARDAERLKNIWGE